jgi:glycosyltransferase involved in cell wall biosynthesis
MTQNESNVQGNTPKVSVIIPCYNLGAYVDEAVDSVLAQTFQDFEIIVVDDGSTEPSTMRLMGNYDRPKTHVLRTKNQGLATARNIGITQARGKYILPLDADDKIGNSYLAKASMILDTRPEIGIVYCRARFFGAREGEWHIEPFSIETMLTKNVIFATAMFRKSSWQKVGGYNPIMVHGYEDYDFWISLLDLEKAGVYRINEILFYYRVREDSMFSTLLTNEENQIDMLTQVFYNHCDFFLRDRRMRVLIAKMHKLNKALEASLSAYPRTKLLFIMFSRWLCKFRSRFKC